MKHFIYINGCVFQHYRTKEYQKLNNYLPVGYSICTHWYSQAHEQLIFYLLPSNNVLSPQF